MVELLLGRAGVWLAGAFVVIFAFGSGYIRGKFDEQDKQKIALNDVIVKQVERIKTVYINDGKVSEAYEKGRKERDNEFKKLMAELEAARAGLEAMPVSCDLPDDVVRLLNIPRSSDRPAPSSSKPAGSMRWATSLEGWQAP